MAPWIPHYSHRPPILRYQLCCLDLLVALIHPLTLMPPTHSLYVTLVIIRELLKSL